MKAAVLALAFAAAVPAQAQHRCTGPDGATTYQQQPCPGAKVEPVRPAAVAAAVHLGQGRTCRAMLALSLKDPESARFSGDPSFEGVVERGGRRVTTWVDAVNARNSFGGYTGLRMYACTFDVTTGAFIEVRQLAQ